MTDTKAEDVKIITIEFPLQLEYPLKINNRSTRNLKEINDFIALTAKSFDVLWTDLVVVSGKQTITLSGNDEDIQKLLELLKINLCDFLGDFPITIDTKQEFKNRIE